MKICRRCNCEGWQNFHQVEGVVLCGDCYQSWKYLQLTVFDQFLGEKIQIEGEVKVVI